MRSIPIHLGVQVVAYAALAVKLVISGLARAYPWFTTFIIFETLRSLAACLIPLRTTAYAYLYFFTQPVAWVLHALVILEVFAVTLKYHAGISSMGRRVIGMAVVAAAVVAGATMILRFETPESQFATLEQYLLIERIINSSLLVFLVALLLFLAYFPVPLPRNALLHATIFTLYFVVKTGLWIVRNLVGQDFTGIMNTVIVVGAVGSAAAWVVFLSPSGETRAVRSSRRSDKQQEERLMAQLDLINRTLTRSARK